MYTDKGIQLLSRWLKIITDKTVPWGLDSPPRPFSFVNITLKSSSGGSSRNNSPDRPENEYDWTTKGGKSGIHARWEQELNPHDPANDNEREQHLISAIDKHSDFLSMGIGSANNHNQEINRFQTQLNTIRARRVNNVPLQATQPSSSVQPGTQPSSSVQPGIQPSSSVQSGTQPSSSVQPGTQPSSSVQQATQGGDTRRGLSIDDLLNPSPSRQNNQSSSLMPFIGINGFPLSTVILTRITPLFNAITPLFLYALGFLGIFYINDVYIFLTSVLGQDIRYVLSSLGLVIYYIFRLLLMIRKAKNSAEKYDRFFTFIANHYKSGLLYLFIFLISLSLILFCA